MNQPVGFEMMASAPVFSGPSHLPPCPQSQFPNRIRWGTGVAERSHSVVCAAAKGGTWRDAAAVSIN